MLTGTTTELSVHTKADGEKPVLKSFSSVGGRNINKNFLSKIFTPSQWEEFVEKCKQDHTLVWLDFIQQFEQSKKAFQYKKDSPVSIDLDYHFSEVYKMITGKEVTFVSENQTGPADFTTVKLRDGRLEISGELVRGVCKPVIQTVCNELKQTMKKRFFNYCGIVLSGGFGESLFAKQYIHDLQEKIELDTFPTHIPSSSTSVIARGAVISAKENK